MTDTDEKTTQPEHTLFRFFAIMFGIYLLSRAFYANHYWNDEHVLTYLAGLIVMAVPSPVTIAGAALVNLYDAWQVMPVNSNSFALMFIFQVCMICAFVWLLIKERGANIDSALFYRHIAPAGRLLLLTMYFFGIFHKINEDFLNPESSCAVRLLDDFIFFPEWLIATDSMRYGAIYATFIIEGAVMIMLLFSRTRYYAVVVGMLFHLFIAFNFYEFYLTFSLLSFLLHVMFLGPQCVKRWQASRLRAIITAPPGKWGALSAAFVMIGLYFAAVWAYVTTDDITYIYAICLPLYCLMCLFVIIYDRPVVNETTPDESSRHYFFSPNYLVAALPVLFFLSCFSPYVGFKNQQNLNMFANLRTEEGESNHLIWRKPIALFPYLNDSVRIISTSDGSLRYYTRKETRRMSQIRFKGWLVRERPQKEIVYEINGERFVYSGTLTPQQEEEYRMPYLMYKLMAFKPILLKRPVPCTDQ